MAKVRVPRTPRKSYNPERRPSKLLLDQVKHLEWAALPASQRKPEQLKVYKQVKTEWQAAERIAQLTDLITAAKDALPIRDVALGALPPVVLPPLPPRRPKKKAVGKGARKTARKVASRPATKRTGGKRDRKKTAGGAKPSPIARATKPGSTRQTGARKAAPTRRSKQTRSRTGRQRGPRS